MPHVSRILHLAATTEYDFRHAAKPDDPLQHHFDDWVPYYRLKWAIARELQPERILEIGVRFGYSAHAFLDAAPDAAYLGIDNDSETFGGSSGAVHWAHRITEGKTVEFLLADSQTLDEFPGGFYDLIHVDGQQDGDSSFRDLEKAIRQAKHVLVDGYFWTEDNFFAVSKFLFTHRHLIASCVIIPGYAGELLITPLPADAQADALAHAAADMQPITGPLNCTLEVVDMPSAVPPDALFTARVRLSNHSSLHLSSRRPNPVHLSYHCDSETGQSIAFDGLRAKIADLAPGASLEFTMNLKAPDARGRCRYRITLVQEGVQWFDGAPHNLSVDAWVNLTLRP